MDLNYNRTTKTIWDLYAQDVKQFILSKVHNTVITDDILQDTFLKIHFKSETLKDVSKLKSWVFSIAKNTILDYYRKHKNYTEFNLEIEEEDNTTYKSHTEKDCLRGIIRHLPKKYRQPLFLSYVIGLKQQDIANRLQLALPTVKSQIQRGKKQVMQGFVDCCDFKVNSQGYLVGEVKDKQDCKVCMVNSSLY